MITPPVLRASTDRRMWAELKYLQPRNIALYYQFPEQKMQDSFSIFLSITDSNLFLSPAPTIHAQTASLPLSFTKDLKRLKEITKPFQFKIVPHKQQHFLRFFDPKLIA